MSHIRDLISRNGVNNETDGLGGNVWYGTVIAPAPATTNDFIFVDIPEFSFLGEVKIGPCRWNTGMLKTDALPQLNDEVIVIFDNRQQPWVVGIWQ